MEEQLEFLHKKLENFEMRYEADKKDFIPRKEHEALNLIGRIISLEEWRLKTVQELGMLRSELRELIITTVAQAVRETLNREILEKSEQGKQKTAFWQWTAGQVLSTLFFLVMLTLTIISLVHSLGK